LSTNRQIPQGDANVPVTQMCLALRLSARHYGLVPGTHEKSPASPTKKPRRQQRKQPESPAFFPAVFAGKIPGRVAWRIRARP